MNLWLAALVILAITAACGGVMLTIRSFLAPHGGFFTDLDRAAGVFGAIGTAFAVLLAFVIFLAFESYSNARSEAGTEAIAVAELFNTARLFPTVEQRDLQGDLICYARAVVQDEWRTMRDGDASPRVQAWISRLDTAADGVTVRTPKQGAAFGHWFETAGQRLEGRRGRLAEAEPFVPSLLWLVLILGAVLLVAYTCFFADPAEPTYVQVVMMGAVAAVAVSGLLTVKFLNDPYENQSGSIEPSALIRSLAVMEHDRSWLALGAKAPCGPSGEPA